MVPVDEKPLSQTISFRITDDEAIRLAALRDTFSPSQWATTFRWLLSQPEVERLVTERIREFMS